MRTFFLNQIEESQETDLCFISECLLGAAPLVTDFGHQKNIGMTLFAFIVHKNSLKYYQY